MRRMIERYAVYRVARDPVVGAEMAKRRPAVVISDEQMNEHLETVVVCPVTSRIHPRWPGRVQTGATGQPAEIAVDQIRTISRRRLGDKLGTLTEAEAAAVRHVITQMYGVLSVSAV
jgi:mRNA interferase MazF